MIGETGRPGGIRTFRARSTDAPLFRSICQLSGTLGAHGRRLPEEAGGYKVGVLVQSNFGKRRTDTRLLLHQLKRLARPVPIGIGRVGGFGGNGSGDIFIAFSTANEGASAARRMRQPKPFPTTRGTR